MVDLGKGLRYETYSFRNSNQHPFAKRLLRGAAVDVRQAPCVRRCSEREDLSLSCYAGVSEASPVGEILNGVKDLSEVTDESRLGGL